MSEEMYCVGRVKDAHGIRGELFIFLKSKRADWLKDLKQLILSESDSGQDLQFFEIEKVRPHKEGLIIKPKEVEDRNRAEELKGLFVFIPRSILSTKSKKNFYLLEILHFQVKVCGQETGSQIIDFSTNTAQDLLVVENSMGRFEIPLVDPFIIEINFSEKWIDLDLPEGLFVWS